MQEWVETLRAKLREMKILSPRENLYTKLPEVRAPLLPTRDPTSPLPAPPPVPAAIVPGVERIPAHQHQQTTVGNEQISRAPAPVIEVAPAPVVAVTAPAAPQPAMSNTLTQHLLNMLSDPISTYSEQISETASTAAALDEEEGEQQQQQATTAEPPSEDSADSNLFEDEILTPILRNGVRVDVAAASAQRISAGKRAIPIKPQTQFK